MVAGRCSLQDARCLCCRSSVWQLFPTHYLLLALNHKFFPLFFSSQFCTQLCQGILCHASKSNSWVSGWHMATSNQNHEIVDDYKI